LAEVVRTPHPIGGFPDLLHRRQQQSDQNRDDSNHHQQLDQCESATFVHGSISEKGKSFPLLFQVEWKNVRSFRFDFHAQGRF
jgi:hypothetical protein